MRRLYFHGSSINVVQGRDLCPSGSVFESVAGCYPRGNEHVHMTGTINTSWSSSVFTTAKRPTETSVGCLPAYLHSLNVQSLKGGGGGGGSSSSSSSSSSNRTAVTNAAKALGC